VKGRCSAVGSEWHFGGDEGPERGRRVWRLGGSTSEGALLDGTTADAVRLAAARTHLPHPYSPLAGGDGLRHHRF
jgi:hypothetical protein